MSQIIVSFQLTFPFPTSGLSMIKVPISCLGILHICNLWMLLRKVVIYLVRGKFYLRGLRALLLKVTEVTSTQESVFLWKHAVIDILYWKYITWFWTEWVLFDVNKQKFSNSWLVCTLKHPGVTKQIPGLTALPSTLTAKKIHEDKIFDRQNILQFFSGVSKD